ncbi:hypothetical protein cypCar_00007812 [Cyprinus carpio]|nr:hypothetical protein cypCar_00007812 [Cyprinus carpio]
MDGQMEAVEQGVLGHLMALERDGMGQQDQHESQRLEMLKVRAVTLRAQRDQLKHQADAVKILKDKISKDLPLDDVDAAGGFIDLQKSLLTAWRMQLKDLQRAHHLIGGYDLVECKEGKSVCVSFHTAFEGVYLETYNMELDLTRTVQISRHNIPPSFPLESIAKQILQKDLKAFLQTLSQKLNAFAAQGETPKAVLCTLEYGDLTQCLPTRVSVECEDKTLSESPQWKKNQSLLLESPAHTALLTMRRMGSIA